MHSGSFEEVGEAARAAQADFTGRRQVDMDGTLWGRGGGGRSMEEERLRNIVIEEKLQCCLEPIQEKVCGGRKEGEDGGRQ